MNSFILLKLPKFPNHPSIRASQNILSFLSNSTNCKPLEPQEPLEHPKKPEQLTLEAIFQPSHQKEPHPMNTLDLIIINKSRIQALATKHDIQSLRLFGAALYREEAHNAPINFLAIFNPQSTQTDSIFDFQFTLERILARRVNIIDSRRIPDNLKPDIFIKPVDIQNLDAAVTYCS